MAKTCINSATGNGTRREDASPTERKPTQRPRASGRVGWLWAVPLVLLGLMGILRLVFVFRYRFDSDEFQHLHLVWAWAQGLLPYRDVFDNHMPIFQVCSLPLYRAWGERPELLFAMRLAMVPLTAVILWATYRIGRALFSAAVGLWAAALTGLFPLFFLCSVEYRSDHLWTALWMMALVVAVGGRPTVRRSLAVGGWIGLAAAVSLKTVLLGLSLVLATAGTWWLTGRSLRDGLRAHWRQGMVAASAALAGPGLVALWFAAHGAWEPFWRDVVIHNVFGFRSAGRMLLFIPALFVIGWAAREFTAGGATEDLRNRRMWIALTGWTYFAALNTLWPMLSFEDYLPFYPLAFLTVVPLAFAREPRGLPRGGAAFARRLRRAMMAGATTPEAWRRRVGHWLRRSSAEMPRPEGSGRGASLLMRGSDAGSTSPLTRPDLLALRRAVKVQGFLIGVFVVVILFIGTPWYRAAQDAIEALRDTLQLVEPNEPVMDVVGETVFRRRACHAVLENISMLRMRRGDIEERMIAEVIGSQTCVASRDDWDLPPAAKRFLDENFLSVGRVRVVGRLLADEPARRRPEFQICIPADYALMAEQGSVSGQLDGLPYGGPRFLAVGQHSFEWSPACTGVVALVWARAVERGFTPFPLAAKTGQSSRWQQDPLLHLFSRPRWRNRYSTGRRTNTPSTRKSSDPFHVPTQGW